VSTSWDAVLAGFVTFPPFVPPFKYAGYQEPEYQYAQEEDHTDCSRLF